MQATVRGGEGRLVTGGFVVVGSGTYEKAVALSESYMRGFALSLQAIGVDNWSLKPARVPVIVEE